MSEAKVSKGEKRDRDYDYRDSEEYQAERRRINRRFYEKWLKKIALMEAKNLLTAAEIEANDSYILHWDWQFWDYSKDEGCSAGAAGVAQSSSAGAAGVAQSSSSSSSTSFQVPPIPNVEDALRWTVDEATVRQACDKQ